MHVAHVNLLLIIPDNIKIGSFFDENKNPLAYKFEQSPLIHIKYQVIF